MEYHVGDKLLKDYRKKLEDGVKFKARPGFLKPSSLGCMVKAKYQFQGIEPTKFHIPSRNLDIMNNGTDRHEAIQRVISQLDGWEWKLIRDEPELITHPRVSIDDYDEVFKDDFETLLRYDGKGFTMRFKADGILFKDNKPYILEIKTIGSKAFDELTKPKEDHVKQVTLYTAMYEISDVIFIYENRDTLEKKAFVINVTDEERLSLYKDIISYIRDDKEVDASHLTPLCDYCEYQDVCMAKLRERMMKK